MQSLNHISSLRGLLSQYRLDGYIISSRDEFGNEYVPAHLRRLQWLSGFSGSYGTLVVLQEKLMLFTDGRYMLQAKQQLDAEVLVLDIYNPSSCELMLAAIKKGSVLGYDPMIESVKSLLYYEKLATHGAFRMQAVEGNLIDNIWSRRSNEQNSVETLGINYSGLSHLEKIAITVKGLQEDSDYLLITDLSSIAWLLNIRGHDVEGTPILLAYAFLRRDGHCFLFTDAVIEFALQNVTIQKLIFATDFFKQLIVSGAVLQADQSLACWFWDCARRKLQLVDDPILLLKACKNETELKNIRLAHFEEGIALTRFFCWLFRSIEFAVTELDAATKLLEYRKKSQNFLYPSFSTISAFGASAAVVHYNPTESSNKMLSRDGLYLVDSGGQYRYGTTDVTRVFCFGQPGLEEKKAYTLVLKGMIRLSLAKFPVGTCGAQLDALARYDLWQQGLDYKHGTGHGVGYFLSVHEGPQAINGSNRIALKPGMILSNEPGYYKVEEYGIRIENLVLVKESSFAGFLEFETLTLAPVATNLVLWELLSEVEKEWLLAYNRSVLDTLSSHLTLEEKEQLQKICAC